MTTAPKTSPIIASLLLSLLLGGEALAQTYSDRDVYSNYPQEQTVDYVTVFEDCNFRGKSRALTIGRYDELRAINIRNDQVSSMQVPDGLNLVLYEHENARGQSTVISSDVSCLNRTWNDRASSVHVVAAPQASANSRTTHNRANSRALNENGPLNNRARRTQETSQQRDLSKGVTSVAFANTALESGPNKQWRITNLNGTVNTFRETARNRQTITLMNNRLNQPVIIDLLAQEVRFFTPTGQRVDYPISRLGYAQDARETQRKTRTAGVIPSSCFRYTARTTGGAGGIRFHGHDGFHQFSSRAHSGRICHNGTLTMELNKLDTNTNLVVEINGQQYQFASNEKEDVLKNSWYRKKVSLQVGP